MKTIETKRSEMFIRAIENRQEVALVEAEGLDGTKLFDDLVQTQEKIRASSYEQSRAQSALRENSVKVDKKRLKLVRRLDDIRRTARRTGISGMENKFLPSEGVPDRGLLTLARTYGTDAFAIKDALHKLGVGVDFINDLSEAAQEFDAALVEREKILTRQKEATANLEAEIEEGMRTVRDLGVIVQNVYAEDPLKLALWESISHVERIPRRSRHDDDDDTPPPTPAQS